MAATARRVSVATTATRLDFASVESDRVFGQSLIVRNRGSASIFVGGPDVTSSTGFEVLAGESFSADIHTGDEVYGIVASGTVPVHIFESGV